MSYSNRLLGIVLACVLVALGGSARAEDAALPHSATFDSVKITVNAHAQADGYLRVRLHPENGEAIEATIALHKHEGENDIAKNLAKALGAVVGKSYEVDRDAGEHVKIRKADRSAPKFSIEISFSAPGFAIVLDD